MATGQHATGAQATGIPPLMDSAFELYKRGQLAEAARLYRRVLELSPINSDALFMLGRLLDQQGNLADAFQCYRRVLSLKPDHEQAHIQTGMILLNGGRTPEAFSHFVQALSAGDSNNAKLGFVQCMKQMVFTQDATTIRRLAARAVSEAWTSPRELIDPALSLVMLNKDIRDCIDRADQSWPRRLSRQALFDAMGLAAVARDPLLRSLLESSPVQSVAMERFLTQARHALLLLASDEGYDSRDDEAVLEFCCALARQCFLNEYVFATTPDETAALEVLRDQLSARLSSQSPFPAIWLALVAAYLPLNTLACADRILALDAGKALTLLIDQQVREPRRERQLRAQIASLTEVDAGVSSQVQAQYEENPYPRWVKAPAILYPLPIDAFLREVAPTRYRPLGRNAGFDVLIAGCGTGYQSIYSAKLYEDSRLLAVDISLSSLSYARRKTDESGLTNIEYAQADITKMGTLERRFDLIESIGVLHHLEDPEAGWRNLCDLLRPGGVMLIALYSELARQDIVAARRFIAEHGYAPTAEDIRRCRQDILSLEGSAGTADLLQRWDFFGTSECRDLLFHTQEQRFTLPQLKEILARLGLRFLGFQLSPAVLNRYGQQFPSDPEKANLDNWHRFETANPRTFRGMYLFWVQK